MFLPSILALSITSVVIWSEPKNVAAECNITPQNCKVSCDYEPLAFVIESLENIWDENRKKCEASGMSLKLENINFPNNTIYKRWFTPDVMLNNLDLILTNVGTIEMDSFDSKPFFTVEEMYIKIALKSLPSGIFNGFTSLTILLLEFAVLPEPIGENIFNVPSKTLETIYIYAGDTDFINPKNNILKLDNFTGSGALSTLEELSIQIPLNDSITRKSFVGLTNIVSMDLSSCQITAIGKGSFDSIGPNLSSLRLTNNNITTLPNDLFQRILLNADLKIYLAGNQLRCDCHLNNFQKYLIENHQKFDDNLTTCESPIEKKSVRVRFANLEPDEECVFVKECYSDFAHQNTSATVHISLSSALISLVETNTGDLVISSEEGINDPTFIWHGGYDLAKRFTIPPSLQEEINCVQGFNATMKSTLLSENIVYTFCYIEEEMTSTSPFNCITYIKVGAVPQIWYSGNSKGYVITVIIASLLMSLLFGIAAGMTFIKIKQRVNDYVHNERTTMKKIGIEISTNQAPPLPERPKTLEEVDPAYTYVG